jgi:ribosomal protein S18 acetylase RimI-like enzyme
VPRAVTISVGSVAEIPELRGAFLSLHEHHRRISAVPLTEPDERAWRARVATYERHFEAGRALLQLARAGGRCVGYAFTVIHDGSDDTFPLGAGHAELYTLAVLPESRALGIGTTLLDALDAELEAREIPHLTVAVMADNDAAIRLYRRRGLLPVEMVMYRVGAAAAAERLRG